MISMDILWVVDYSTRNEPKNQNKTSNKGLTIIPFSYVLISSLQNTIFGACAKDEHNANKII